jgi:hypothetical protein
MHLKELLDTTSVYKNELDFNIIVTNLNIFKIFKWRSLCKWNKPDLERQMLHAFSHI